MNRHLHTRAAMWPRSLSKQMKTLFRKSLATLCPANASKIAQQAPGTAERLGWNSRWYEIKLHGMNFDLIIDEEECDDDPFDAILGHIRVPDEEIVSGME